MRLHQLSAMERYSSAYNRKHGARSLSDLETGQVVRLKSDNQKQWSPPAVVSGSGSMPRSYVLETADGKTVRRNRRHIQVIPDVVPETSLVPVTDGVISSGVAHHEIPKESVQETSYRTSSGRIVNKPKRYIEQC